MRGLLQRQGRRDSLGYFALRRDKSRDLVSPTGKAAIAYRVVSGVMLASGDPIGDPEAWPGAISRFLERGRRGTPGRPAVIGLPRAGGEVWCREHGLDALELGDEAIVEVARVHPRGPADAQRAADGQPGRAAGLRVPGAPAAGHPAPRRWR